MKLPATAVPTSAWRLQMMTRAPRLAKSLAISLPMPDRGIHLEKVFLFVYGSRRRQVRSPLLPPVTRAVLPSSRFLLRFIPQVNFKYTLMGARKRKPVIRAGNSSGRNGRISSAAAIWPSNFRSVYLFNRPKACVDLPGGRLTIEQNEHALSSSSVPSRKSLGSLRSLLFDSRQRT